MTSAEVERARRVQTLRGERQQDKEEEGGGGSPSGGRSEGEGRRNRKKRLTANEAGEQANGKDNKEVEHDAQRVAMER